MLEQQVLEQVNEVLEQCWNTETAVSRVLHFHSSSGRFCASAAPGQYDSPKKRLCDAQHTPVGMVSILPCLSTPHLEAVRHTTYFVRYGHIECMICIRTLQHHIVVETGVGTIS